MACCVCRKVDQDEIVIDRKAGDDVPEGALQEGIETPNMTAEEKATEKERLQTLVKEFSKEAVLGMEVSLITPETWADQKAMLLLDKGLQTCTIASGTETEKAEIFPLHEVVSLRRGNDLAEVHENIPPEYLLTTVEIKLTSEAIFLVALESTEARDRFYTCIKIIRMSVELAKRKSKTKRQKD